VKQGKEEEKVTQGEERHIVFEVVEGYDAD